MMNFPMICIMFWTGGTIFDIRKRKGFGDSLGFVTAFYFDFVTWNKFIGNKIEIFVKY